MIERFHPEVRILARQSVASDADLSAILKQYPTLPSALTELMREASELELAYRGRYLRLYGPRGCLEMDQAYSISARLPGAIVIGDNGGGEAILFLPGKGLHRVGYGALDPEEVHFIAKTLEDLLVHATATPEAIGGVRA